MRQDRLERPTFGSLPTSAQVGARALLCTRHEHLERKLASPGLRGLEGARSRPRRAGDRDRGVAIVRRRSSREASYVANSIVSSATSG
jgi:hypothetical protein